MNLYSAMALQSKPDEAEKPTQAEQPQPQPRPTKVDEKPTFPANDPGISSIFDGEDIDPTNVIEFRPKSEIKIPEAEGERWKPKVLDLVSANENSGPKYVDFDTEENIVSVGTVDEAEFVEFWAVDAWDALSFFGNMFKIDIHEIETDPEDHEQAFKAARHMYKMAQKYPKWFGWMRSEATINGGDWMAAAAFFGGKGIAVFKGVQERRQEKRLLQAQAKKQIPAKAAQEGKAKPENQAEAKQ